MGKQTNEEKLAEITGVISGVISTTIASNSNKYQKNMVVGQFQVGSKGCDNISISKSNVVYQATSQVVAQSYNYQSIVATIVNQLTSTQGNESDGSLLTPTQENKLAAVIGNLIQSNLDSQTMAAIGNVTADTTVNIQVCIDSENGNNIFFNTEDDAYTYYNTVYSQSATVQKVSADISNILDAEQTNKRVGVLAMIIKAIALICIVIIIVIAVALGVYLLTVVKL